MGLKKQVIQYKDGIEIRRYDSTVEAANNNGTTIDVISKCCCGKQKGHNGYTYAYSGEFTNKVVKYVDGDYKCPYCDKKFNKYVGLMRHLFTQKTHTDIGTKEDILTIIKYDGDRPKCKCGCGRYTEIAYDGGAHFRDYIHGHIEEFIIIGAIMKLLK